MKGHNLIGYQIPGKEKGKVTIATPIDFHVDEQGIPHKFWICREVHDPEIIQRLKESGLFS